MYYMIPSHVFSHILFVQKLCIVILHLFEHTGSITLVFTILLSTVAFHTSVRQAEGVKGVKLCLDM